MAGLGKYSMGRYGWMGVYRVIGIIKNIEVVFFLSSVSD